MAFTTQNTEHLTRSLVWSSQIKEILEDELRAMIYVDMLSDFPDGDTFNIPSIGQAEVDDYVENSPVTYRAMDTGNFTFTINKYKSSATFITKKQKQDMFYMNQLVSTFVPKMQRALMVEMEKDILGLSNSQTLANKNNINGTAHRFVASGTNQVITVADFAGALHSLKKANVGDMNLTAIVDPSVEHTLNTLTELVNVSNNPKWEGIVSDGIASGMRFIKNVYGFDVYTSNYLVADIAETIGTRTVADGVANMFFSADASILPFMGAIRQAPEVDSEFNKDLQRDEFIVTARWGFKLYRPENLVVILSDANRVSYG